MSTMPGWSWTTCDDGGNPRRDRASGKTEDGMFSAELFFALDDGVVGLLYRIGEVAPVLTLSVAGPSARAIQYAMVHAAERMRGGGR